MALIPFTFEQAEEIREDFEDLVDTEFSFKGAAFMIDDVVVSPFKEEDKTGFMRLYQEVKDGRQALAGYADRGYDVIIIASDVDNEQDVSFITIRSFIAEKGVSYNFPE